MRFIPSQTADPESNLAIEEQLLAEGVESLFFWETEAPVIILGRFGKASTSLKTGATRTSNIPILHRTSGGGTVVLAKGCLNYTLIFDLNRRPHWANVEQSFEEILQPIASALDIEFRPPSDLARNNRKVGGCAQHRTAAGLLHHGTLLYDFDPALAERYLHIPARQPPYRRNRSHSEFLANIPLQSAEIRSRLTSLWI